MQKQSILKEVWPNFFIVGPPKTGTTSLYEYLKKVPEIYMSRIKEPTYFSSATVPKDDPVIRPIRNKEEYLNLFKDGNCQKIRGEASATYFSDPKAPIIISKIIPEAKILVSLRDPVERGLSHYRNHIEKFGISFHDKIKKEMNEKSEYCRPNVVLRNGLYNECLKRFLDVFGTKQVKIIIFEEWILEPKNVVEEILQFLGINYKMNEFQNEVHNPYKPLRTPRGSISKYFLNSETAKKMAKQIIPISGRKLLQKKILSKEKPKLEISKKDIEFLKEFYHEDVKKVQRLLGRNLAWKNFIKLK